MQHQCAPWPQMVIGNIAVDLVDRDEVFALIQESLAASGPLAVVSANLHHIHEFASKDAQSHRLSTASIPEPADGLRWLTLLDGVPLVRKANALSGQRWPKLSGSDLIVPIVNDAAARGTRIGFLGGTHATHRQLREILAQSSPRVCIAGTWAPSSIELHDAAESERIAAEIRDADVEILFVALGKPRQEEWIARHGLASGARVMLAFGAAVDFLAGRRWRAPKIVADVGAEWAWRLILEPRRLGRRYLIECPPALLRLRRTASVREGSLPWCRFPTRTHGRFITGAIHSDISAVVVTHNSAPDISRLIEDLRLAASERPIRVIVVDNQSSDETVDIVRRNGDITLVESGGNLGYAGGINVGLPLIGICDSVLILNPDSELAPDAISRLHTAIGDERIGAVVPLILDADGVISPSLFREPSLSRAFFDALLGSKIRTRPGFMSEFDLRPSSYARPHATDWATGAALLVPSKVVRDVGLWSEEFFLYSEEVDYFRRIRATGRSIRFEPAAVIKHRGGGSGRSPELATLRAVNRVRYIERYHGRSYSALFRVIAGLSEALRFYDPVHRRTFATIANRKSWDKLPRARKATPPQKLSGRTQRGAVIVPAYNEAQLIARTLAPLSRAAVDGFIELIVVCNGCTDRTAEIARNVPGARVVELEQGYKPAALNAGDQVATLWPRLYLDADVRISAQAVLAVFDRLALGDVLVASPAYQYDWTDASAIVRSYYRTAIRTHRATLAMWRAGAYALNAEGHARFGAFPDITGDDLFVDTRFSVSEKIMVETEPSVRQTPVDAKSLLSVARRHRRGGAELLTLERKSRTRQRGTALRTVVVVAKTIRGPRSAVDAAVFLGVALAARFPVRNSVQWERDDSSRSAKRNP